MARRVGWTVMLAALLGMIVSAAGRADATDTAGDSRTVYCVRSGNERPLVKAAVALGLATGGATGTELTPVRGGIGVDLTVAEWARRDPDGFGRACAALVAARLLPAQPRSRLLDQLIPVLSAVIGAILAYIFGIRTARSARSDRAADELQAAVTAYARACRRCLTAWRYGRGREFEDAMEEPFEDLQAVLRRCAGQHRRWRAPLRLHEALRELDHDIRATAWPPDDPAPAANAYLERLEHLQLDLMRVVAAVERPGRPHPSMFRGRRAGAP
ncbi:hypothetical protein AGRA3207_002033 [Actinomadura graeca]|uniref:Integral membrane protein n=1 Tax=Actinomadura graeca TaxID=2750812 RepID=A0ABX8QQX5_9ACTN|nr:hypothetical protein [Actinomadura graeca]QXJ21201.1 hypothetical protein AGRA3207_002033 [Actinomadura graeca]